MDLKKVYTARSALRKILSDIQEMEEYRDEIGMVDGYMDVDSIKRTAKRAYAALKRFLQEIGEYDAEAVEE